jgi:DNA-binding NarL/FixJ family response regulator
MPTVACLMLTSFADDDALMDAVMAGAAGYVLKQIRGSDLVGAVRTVATGQSMLDPQAAGQLMARLRGQSGQPARPDPLARVPALRPDVAVLDVRLPDGDGVSVCRALRSRTPETACLMLTSFGDDEALLQAVMAGAAGYVLKQIRGTDLVGAVRTVATGQSMLDPRAAGKLMARLRDQSRKRDPLAELTDQERTILELIGEGLTNRQIGERMFLAEKTVKNYVSGLFAKLGMQRRTQAAAYAARIFGEHDSTDATRPAG